MECGRSPLWVKVKNPNAPAVKRGRDAPAASRRHTIAVSDALPVGLGFRSGHTSRRERNPAGVVVHFGVLEPALVSGIVQS